METIKLLLPPLLAVIGVIGLAYLAVRTLGRRNGGLLASGRLSVSGGMRVVERMPLSRDAQLVLVWVAGRYLLLSVSTGGTSLLCELSEETLEQAAQGAAQKPETDFLQALSAAFSKRKGGGEK